MYVGEIPMRLSKMRMEKGVSARDMSLSIGQNMNYINNIENGKALPSMEGFLNICEYLGITPGEFFDEGNAYPLRLRELVADLKRLDESQLQAVSLMVQTLLKK